MDINMDTIIKDCDSRLRGKSVPVPLPLSETDKTTLMDLLTYVRESTDPQLAEEKKPAAGGRYRGDPGRHSPSAAGGRSR